MSVQFIPRKEPFISIQTSPRPEMIYRIYTDRKGIQESAMKSYTVLAASLTDTGLVRRDNQDAVYTCEKEGLHVFCLADGMGGCQHGELASRAVTDAVRRWTESFYSAHFSGSFGEICDDFEKTLQSANKFIYETLQKDGPCGTTVVCLLIYQEFYSLFWVGDSRIYRRRGLSFTPLTRDDVWQNLPEVAARNLSEDELKADRDYGKLSAAIGTEPRIYPNRAGDQLKPGDLFLLCSDGAYRPAGDPFLKRLTRGLLFGASHQKLEAAAQAVREQVYRQGAGDNLSVILVKVLQSCS